MRYAIVNNEKIVATKGAKGACPSCGSDLIAKCGELKVNHWSHQGNRNCDPWWENETEWHRAWKDNFVKEWQEVVHTDENSGEKHIADVKTNSDWVIEFQHSQISLEERNSRNNFYPKLIWVLDGTRRKRDKVAFHRLLDEFSIESDDPKFNAIIGQDDCRLIKEWHKSNALVFLDFKDEDELGRKTIWFLFPKIAENEAYLLSVLLDDFVDMHKMTVFDEFIENTISPFINKLAYKEKIKIEMGQSREREGKARMDMLLYGRRTL
ncbi:MAG: competence protein CoiA family protein [Saccharospirillum sp.]|uniref:competence protein CoiA n=1 Tax=Saccharospirillum sp. TaxID=2033801 RepID=UPI0032985F87